MARIPGIDPDRASWWLRILFGFVRRKVRQLTGRSELPEPIRITAHHPRLFVALAQMEMGQAAARALPDKIKALASIKTATLIGCPY